ncbi:type II toxin-antitoxin system HicA family toxin [Variovorax sp. ZT4R33]|uniref:type II toxin-antitoxin system HicA family toxin n=1 Tax=Variovorax sp. ZT4R33 TaxID=3443743 RepID=UPI003F46FB40
MSLRSPNRLRACAPRESAPGRQGRQRDFKHPTKPGHVVIPHPRKDTAIGTLRNTYRQAGWTWR